MRSSQMSCGNAHRSCSVTRHIALADILDIGQRMSRRTDARSMRLLPSLRSTRGLLTTHTLRLFSCTRSSRVNYAIIPTFRRANSTKPAVKIFNASKSTTSCCAHHSVYALGSVRTAVEPLTKLAASVTIKWKCAGK